jgi:FecR protein
MNDEPRSPTTDEELLPRLFRAMGPTPALPPAMKRAWETTFERELFDRIAARRRRVRIAGANVAALLLLSLVGVYLYRAQSTVPQSEPALSDPIRVTMISGRATISGTQPARRLTIGEDVGMGQTVSTAARSLLALRFEQADVRLNAGTSVVLHPARLQLLYGELYLDSGTAPRREPPVAVETPFGTLTHVGTQFEVTVTRDEVRAAVREGSVRFAPNGLYQSNQRLDEAQRNVSAADGATEIVISATGVITQDVPGTGERWQWIVDAAPAFVIDGRSADAFLHWATRQTGARLRYADDAARFRAETVILHGAARGVSVALGLDVVDSTTGLDLDTSDPATLRVSLSAANPGAP